SRRDCLDRHHQTVHTNKRSHKCEYPKCNRAFKRPENLKRHRITAHTKGSYMNANTWAAESRLGRRIIWLGTGNCTSIRGIINVITLTATGNIHKLKV